MGKKQASSSSSSKPKAEQAAAAAAAAAAAVTAEEVKKPIRNLNRIKNVKSGNAGNSKDAVPLNSTAARAQQAIDEGRPPPLFPVGALAPRSLVRMHEHARMQFIRIKLIPLLRHFVTRLPYQIHIGYKTPITILNERCQKNGWQKPDLQPVRFVPSYTYVSDPRWNRQLTALASLLNVVHFCSSCARSPWLVSSLACLSILT